MTLIEEILHIEKTADRLFSEADVETAIEKMAESINYPPTEILQPSFDKPDYELIILWLFGFKKLFRC